MGDKMIKSTKKAATLPDCMAPDGAEPCAAYASQTVEIEQLRRVMTISRDLCIFLRDTKVGFNSPGLVELEQAIKAVTAKDTD